MLRKATACGYCMQNGLEEEEEDFKIWPVNKSDRL